MTHSNYRWLQAPAGILKKAMSVACQDSNNLGELEVKFPTRARMALMIKVVSGYPRALNLEAFPRSGRQLLQGIQLATGQPTETMATSLSNVQFLDFVSRNFARRT